MTEWLRELSSGRRVMTLFWLLNAIIFVCLILFAIR